MGALRNNQPRAVTEEKVRQLVRELLAAGQTAFPSERELAARTGGSRSVIREILEAMEQKQQLLRTANGRSLNPEANRIPVLFVAGGRNMIDNPAWARLWLALVNRMKGTPLAPELFLLRYWPEEIAEDLQTLAQNRARYLILCINRNLEPLIRQWCEEKRNILFPDEGLLHYGLPVISIDNTRVGELAAQQLFEHGFRTPALLTPDFTDHRYSPYQKRIAGFTRECARLGLDFQPERDCYRVYYGKGRLQSCIQETTKIADQTRYDSLFLTTDDLLLLVLEVLNDQQRYTPGSFGLITLNSQNNALSGNARVNAISSATNELATLITDRIQAHADGLIDQLPTIAITPTIHEGETLCIRQKS